MARYELILILDGALWPTIISGDLLTPKRGAPAVEEAVVQICACRSTIYIFILLARASMQ